MYHVEIPFRPHTAIFRTDLEFHRHSDRLTRFSKFAGELRGLLGPIGGRSSGPTLWVGGHALSQTNYSVRPWDGDGTALGVLGNDVLRRFDTILDNREGVVYLRPNEHVGARYRNPERLVVRVGVGLIIGATAAVAMRWALRTEQ